MSSVWGVVSEDKQFKLLDPELKSKYNDGNDENIKSYYDYLEYDVHPYPEYDESVSMIERKKNNAIIKQMRTEKIKTFLDSKLGSEFKRDFEQLKKLLLRKSSMDRGVTIDNATEKDFVNIIPAFFQLMLHLCETRRDFQLIIRTFGSKEDIDSVIEEFNSFCAGSHPDFSLTDLQKEFFQNKQILADKDEMVGHVYRNSPTNAYFIPNHLEFVDGMLSFTPVEKLNLGSRKVISGFKDIYNNIVEKSKTGESRLIRDFYYWWCANSMYTHSGKIFLIDENDNDVMQIFFDDNVSVYAEFPLKGIVDLRSVNTMEPLDQSVYLDSFIVNAYALDFIRDDQYYVNKLIQAEIKRRELK
ncbi:predicted protein [Naegleria gruberi]|uniref:Predicted protein n=1 Tax=Naegleria gruberi TaxID=5762 RepID=D2VK50_NAEGR|nr:uncharacterized protein NAEGRDRAFT_50211 [Naegleria gruberi]EFC42885.1 predicted protein [Naegleria gruberi]|eukprot:XP_002675629.1 predicted protein [Naegleria gruberi strain NEG-M]